MTQIENARAGATRLPSFRAVAAPLPAALERAGIISPIIFADRLVTLDFVANQLIVRDKSAANTPAGAPTPYHGAGHGHGLPAIPVVVGGQTFMAHMDTGAPHTISFPYAMAAQLPFAAPPVEAGQARFIDGAHNVYRGTLQGEVQVGPLVVTNPEVGLIDGLPFVNVGMGLLQQLNVTLDPAEQRAWIARRS